MEHGTCNSAYRNQHHPRSTHPLHMQAPRHARTNLGIIPPAASRYLHLHLHPHHKRKSQSNSHSHSHLPPPCCLSRAGSGSLTHGPKSQAQDFVSVLMPMFFSLQRKLSSVDIEKHGAVAGQCPATGDMAGSSSLHANLTTAVTLQVQAWSWPPCAMLRLTGFTCDYTAQKPKKT